VKQLSVLNTFEDSVAAMKAYAKLHHEAPVRDLSRFIITIRDVLPPGPEDLRTHTWFK